MTTESLKVLGSEIKVGDIVVGIGKITFIEDAEDSLYVYDRDDRAVLLRGGDTFDIRRFV